MTPIRDWHDGTDAETRHAVTSAVLDEVGSSSAVAGGWFETIAPGVLLAAADPARVWALVWWNPTPRTAWAPDYPWSDGPDMVESRLETLKLWGTRRYGEVWADEIGQWTGSRPSDTAIEWWAKKARNACTPDVAEESHGCGGKLTFARCLPASRL